MKITKIRKTIAKVIEAFLALIIFGLLLEIFVRVSIFHPQWIDWIMFGKGSITYSIRRGEFYWSSFGISDAGYRLALYCSVKKYCKDVDPWWPGSQDFDPDLGWTSPSNDSINSNIISTSFENHSEAVIPFYGDSFVEGWQDKRENTIPFKLENELDNVTVPNLGVSGYGLDQIFLRFEKTIDSFNSKQAIVGIYYDDLNRCLYKLYDNPKPNFTIENNQLHLNQGPQVYDPAQWIKNYPPYFYRSFALDFTVALIRKAFHSPFVVYHISPNLIHWESKSERAQMAHLSELLIKQFRQESLRRNIRLTFVIFPSNLIVMENYHSWHHDLLLSILKKQGLSYIDCTESYRDYLHSHPTLKPLTIFDITGHPTPELNQIIARQIARRLHEDYGYTVRQAL